MQAQQLHNAVELTVIQQTVTYQNAPLLKKLLVQK
jgi:hypothetical protein